MRIAAITACLFLSGCQLFNRSGAIKSGGVSVQGVPDAGKPATLQTLTSGETIPLKALSRVVITRYRAAPAKPATADSPAVAAQPEREETVIVPAGDTQWQRTEARVQADTGTVDTSVRQKQIEAQESRPLLYAALLAVAAAGLFIYIHYPTPSYISGGAAVVFFLAWKVSGLPSWFWALGAMALVASAFLYLGHERGEKSAAQGKA